MSWTRDIDGELVNLDYVQQIEITELEVEEATDPTHALVAIWSGNSESIILMSGDEKTCRAKLDQIALKLHMIGDNSK